MGTKRTPLNRSALPRLTDEMVTLYLQLRAADLDELTGDARASHIAAFHRLHALCGLRPWHVGPADIGDAPPDYVVRDTARLERWRETHRWTVALEAAAAETGARSP